MSTSAPAPLTSLTASDLESMLRRVVREEFARLLRTPVRSIVEDWTEEQFEDASGDEVLLQEALAVLQQYGDEPGAWMSWEDFETELDRAEAAGELPN